MIVSSGLPTCMEGMMYPVPFTTVDDLITIAKHAEQLGYHSVWGNDHMTTQHYVREKFNQSPNFWEPLIIYAHLAAHTTNLRFGTGMLVTPMRRDIVVVAKQVATLDQLSKGRLILGLGVGAYREEFEALHPNWKVHRGDLLEENIQVLRKLFSEQTITWEGEYYQIKDVNMFPKPSKTLPIYIGGNNPNAIRRASIYGDGWLPAGMAVEQAREKIVQFKDMIEKQNRDFEKIDVAMQLVVRVDNNHEQAIKRFKQSQMYNHLISLSQSTLKDQENSKHVEINLIGNFDEVIEKAKRFEEAGVKHLCGLYFCAESINELLDQMQVFAEEIVPHIS